MVADRGEAAKGSEILGKGSSFQGPSLPSRAGSTAPISDALSAANGPASPSSPPSAN